MFAFCDFELSKIAIRVKISFRIILETARYRARSLPIIPILIECHLINGHLNAFGLPQLSWSCCCRYVQVKPIMWNVCPQICVFVCNALSVSQSMEYNSHKIDYFAMLAPIYERSAFSWALTKQNHQNQLKCCCRWIWASRMVMFVLTDACVCTVYAHENRIRFFICSALLSHFCIAK